MTTTATFPVPVPLLCSLVAQTMLADAARHCLSDEHRLELYKLVETLDAHLDGTPPNTIEPKPTRTRKPKTKSKPSPRRSQRKVRR